MYLETHLTTIDPADAERVERLVPAAIAALRARVPGLLRFDSARLADGTYLDVLVWDREEDAAAAVAAIPAIPEAVELHGLLRGSTPIGAGQVCARVAG